MALTKLTADLEIISALDNEPNDISGLTAVELKAKFDKAGNLIKTFINESLTVETDAHIADISNPHGVTKAQVTLGNVDNTADADKPVSTAQQAELDLKANRLDVLEKTNTTAYTPTADYNPATKKYVDSTAEGVVLGQIPDGSLSQAKLGMALSEKIDNAIPASQKGVANGVASLDGAGKVPSGQLPQVGLLPRIIVSVDSDSTVTATFGGITVSGTSVGGICSLDVPNFGTWVVTATLGAKSNTKNIAVDAVKIYEVGVAYTSIYGFTINQSESNPSAAVAYTDESTAFTKGSSAWDTSSLFAHIKPCLFKDGAVVGYLQRDDCTKFENGTAADITSGDAGDVMVEIPKMAYYMEKSGSIITCKVLVGDVDAKTIDARYSYLPFSRDSEGDRSKTYIGAYLGFELSGKLRSLSGKSPTTNKTIGAFRTLAQANGTGYQQLPFYPLTLLQILYIMKYGSLDSQTALGRGYVDGNAAAATTGGTNSKGFCFGETTGKQQMKIFGIEDFWGNLYQWVDGLFCNASWAILTTYKAFNDTGSGYLFNNTSGNSANTGGYMAVSQGGTQTGFNIKTAAGSESTYYADYAILNADGLPNFGGHWATASGAGAFQLYVSRFVSSAGSNFGARLCFI